jgi:hypothetical protein
MLTDLLYQWSSLSISLALLVMMVVANECGFRLGRFIQKNTDDEVKSLTGAIQGSILGLLALLLGFTFSMSMQRYDSRVMSLVSESNAIGTTVLRAQLLPSPYDNQSLSLLERYIDNRIAISAIDITRDEERMAFDKNTQQLQKQLWGIAIQSVKIEPVAVTSGNYLTALNEMIDAQSQRNAFLITRVPDVVLILLFTVFLSSGAILGYSSGLSGKRVLAPTLLVSFLLSTIVFIILDLDRPKRGYIKVDQNNLKELKLLFQQTDIKSISPIKTDQ